MAYINPSDEYRTKKAQESKTTSAMNYNAAPYVPRYDQYGLPITSTPTTTTTTTTTPKTTTPKTTTKTTTEKTTTTTPKTTATITTQPERDIAAEIAAEMSKSTIDWAKVGQLAQERDAKIAATGIQTKSTQDYINELYAKRSSTGNGTYGVGNDTYIAGSGNENQTMQPVEPDIQQYIRDLTETQRKSRIAALDKALQNAMTNLADQEASIKPRYYDARNQAAAQSDIAALNFAQYMAGRGIKGAAGGMPEIYRNAALQSNIGALNRQEQTAYDTIARQRANLQNAYEQDRLAALADLDAQELQAVINQINADRQFGLQEAGLTGLYRGTPTLAAQQQKFNQAVTEAGLTGQYNGQPTFDYKRWLDETEYRNRAFDENVRQFNLKYGLDLKNLSLQEAQQKIDAAYKQGQLSLAQAQQALAEAKYIDEQKRTQSQDYSNYTQRAIEMLQEGTYDNLTGQMIKKYTPEQVRAWVLSLPLTDQQIANILNQLGL